MDRHRWRERAGSFGAAAEVYDRSRPSYPVEAVRWALPPDARRTSVSRSWRGSRDLAPDHEPFALPYLTDVWRSVRA